VGGAGRVMSNQAMRLRPQGTPSKYTPRELVKTPRDASPRAPANTSLVKFGDNLHSTEGRNVYNISTNDNFVIQPKFPEKHTINSAKYQLRKFVQIPGKLDSQNSPRSGLGPSEIPGTAATFSKQGNNEDSLQDDTQRSGTVESRLSP